MGNLYVLAMMHLSRFEIQLYVSGAAGVVEAARQTWSAPPGTLKLACIVSRNRNEMLYAALCATGFTQQAWCSAPEETCAISLFGKVTHHGIYCHFPSWTHS